MIKKTDKQHAGNTIIMVYCDFCGEGVSNRTEDVEAVKRFKDEHKICKKEKNTKIDFKNMQDVL